MASNTSVSGWSQTKAAMEIGKEYTDIYTSVNDWIQFHTDFMVLMRGCIADRINDSASLPSRIATRFEILNRPTSKAYDARAQAAGKPTLFERATQQAQHVTHADLDREADGVVASSAEDRDQFVAEMMSGEMMEMFIKLMQKRAEKDE